MSLLSSEPCVCFKCGSPYEIKERLERNAVCVAYHADLHCCLNCRHYSAHAHNECNETQAEWVRDKDRSNYCDYFDPKRGAGRGKEDLSRDEARARFDSFFRK